VAISSHGRVGRYLTSTKNLAGAGLAVAGPVLALTGVIAPPIGLALVPVLYAVGALAAPEPKQPELTTGVDAEDVTKSLSDLRRRIQGRVPPDIEGRVQRIATTINDILPRADELGQGSEARYVLVKTATDYLPSTVEAYLDLPRSYANDKVLAGGKTARKLVCEQLDILIEQMDEVSDAVNRADTDKLVANGRFLAEKFATSPLDLAKPSGATPTSLPPPGTPPPSTPPPPEAPRRS